ncbi:MAG: hypothetical protein R3E01_22080 [Pirellulaceae bacterium]|nr:hypothetical protein [Planctomycetales bacterium]
MSTSLMMMRKNETETAWTRNRSVVEKSALVLNWCVRRGLSVDRIKGEGVQVHIYAKLPPSENCPVSVSVPITVRAFYDCRPDIVQIGSADHQFSIESLDDLEKALKKGTAAFAKLTQAKLSSLCQGEGNDDEQREFQSWKKTATGRLALSRQLDSVRQSNRSRS